MRKAVLGGHRKGLREDLFLVCGGQLGYLTLSLARGMRVDFASSWFHLFVRLGGGYLELFAVAVEEVAVLRDVEKVRRLA